MAATRKRTKRPQWRWNGHSIAEWRSNSERVHWAQTSTEFNAMVTTVMNARFEALRGIVGSEPRLLGAVEGYDAAVTVLLSLAEGAAPPADTEPPVEFSGRNDAALEQFND